MSALASTIWDNLPKLVTSVAATGVITLLTYLYKAGSWTKAHQRARLFEEQGDRFLQNEIWESAIIQYKLAIPIWEEEVNQPKMLSLYQKLGKAYNRAGDIDNALHSFMHCEVLWDAIKKDVKMQEVFYELSQAYLSKRDLERASLYINKSIHLLREQKSPRLPVALAMAARVAKERGRPEEAENAYLEAVQILESISDTLGLASVYYELGELKAAQKMRDLASNYYAKSIANHEKLGSVRAGEIRQKLAAKVAEVGD
jgi:tetratricopeptide (TPR) repeat protein